MPMLSHNLGPKVGPYSLGEEEEEEEEPSLEALAHENGVQAVTRELTQNQFGENPAPGKTFWPQMLQVTCSYD